MSSLTRLQPPLRTASTAVSTLFLLPPCRLTPPQTDHPTLLSSIKRDVKKKAPPRPEDRGSFSRSSPLCFVTSEDVRLVDHLVSFLCCWWQRSSVQDAASRTTVSRVGGGALTRWPPSAAQTVRADFRHTAFTKTPASGSPNRAKVLER